MSPRLRKFGLTAHISLSVGWLGTVAVLLALGIIGQPGPPDSPGGLPRAGAGRVVRLAAIGLRVADHGDHPVGRQHLGPVPPPLGPAELAINVFANIVLLIYMQTLTTLATMAADPTMDLQTLRDSSPLDHAVLALLLLIIATGLAVFKPRAMTRYGWRKQQQQRAAKQREQRPQVPAE